MARPTLSKTVVAFVGRSTPSHQHTSKDFKTLRRCSSVSSRAPQNGTHVMLASEVPCMQYSRNLAASAFARHSTREKLQLLQHVFPVLLPGPLLRHWQHLLETRVQAQASDER